MKALRLNQKTKQLYKMTMHRTAALLAALTFFAGFSGWALLPAEATAPTTFFNIGTLGGNTSDGHAINNNGDVVGRADTSSGVAHAFYWRAADQTMTDLNGSEYSTWANGVNDIGVTVGYADSSSDPSTKLRAVMWANDPGHTMSDLSDMPAGVDTEARAVNNSGVVAGWYQNGSVRATFVWDSINGFTALPTTSPGDACEPTAINSSNVIVGKCGQSAVRWDASHNLTNLGTIVGGISSFAYGINDAGKIIGTVNGASSPIFMINNDLTTVDMSQYNTNIGTDNSGVFDINNSDQIAGFFTDPTDGKCGPLHAFVIDPEVGFIDVGTDGTVTRALSINDNAQVSGASNPFYCETAPAPTGFNAPARSGKVFAAGSAAANKTALRAAAWGTKLTPPTVSVGDASVTRTNTGTGKNVNIHFPVRLSIPSRTQVTVNYSISGGGSATAGSDFKLKTGNVTFKPNATTGLSPTTLYVNTIVYPGSNATDETFNVTLNSVTNTGGGEYGLGDAAGVGTISANGASGLRVNVGDSSISEGDHGKSNSAKVTVSLSQPATTTVTVTLSLSDGTAIAKTDYTKFAPKTVTFTAGQWQKTVAIQTRTNMFQQSDRTINVTLSNPSSGLSLGRSSAVVTLLNDD